MDTSSPSGLLLLVVSSDCYCLIQLLLDTLVVVQGKSLLLSARIDLLLPATNEGKTSLLKVVRARLSAD